MWGEGGRGKEEIDHVDASSIPLYAGRQACRQAGRQAGRILVKSKYPENNHGNLVQTEHTNARRFRNFKGGSKLTADSAMPLIQTEQRSRS